MPGQNNEYAWQKLLDNLTKQIETIISNTIPKDEIRREFEIIQEKFQIIEDRESDRRETDQTFQRDYLGTKQRSEAAFTFFQNFQNAMKWLMRAIFVAGLSLASSIFLSFYNGTTPKPYIPPPGLIPNVASPTPSAKATQHHG